MLFHLNILHHQDILVHAGVGAFVATLHFLIRYPGDTLPGAGNQPWIFSSPVAVLNRSPF